LGIGVSGTQNNLEVVGNTYLNGVATIAGNLLAQSKVIANAIDVTTELKFANTTGKKITIGSAGSNFGLATTVSEFQIYGNNASFGSVKIGFLNQLNGNFISRVTVPNIGSTSIITDGNIISTAFIVSSDARFKTNINTLSNSLENLMTVRGTSYFFRTKEFPQKSFSTNRQLGVIAQEIEGIFPELVTTGEDGYKSVNYIGFIPVIIESIKELKKELNTKTNDIETLKKEMASLKSMVLEIQNVK
jgi:Chaperone of endosialidase